MPFARRDFDELARQVELYLGEIGASSVAVDVTTVDGHRLCVLKVLDVTENTVTFLTYDERVGIDPAEGSGEHRHETVVLVPHDAIRSVVFGPSRASDSRAAFRK